MNNSLIQLGNILGLGGQAPVPYEMLPEQYETSYKVIERIREMMSSEASCFEDALPDDLLEVLYSDDTVNIEAIRERFDYYGDKARMMVDATGTIDLEKYMTLAVYQVDFGMNTDIDINNLLLTIAPDDELRKLLGFDNLFYRHILNSNICHKKQTKQCIEAALQLWQDESAALTHTSVESGIRQALKSELGDDCEAWVIIRRYRDFCHAINDKIKKLDLREYLSIFIQGRELCLNYDRFVDELKRSVALNQNLREFYKRKEAALLAEYEGKVAELEARRVALEAVVAETENG